MRKNRKHIYCITAGLIVLAILGLCLGVLNQPSFYVEPVPIESNEISPYLTAIYSTLHNNLQLGKPFKLVISESVIYDIIARTDWPIERDGVIYSMPMVNLLTNRLRIAVAVELKGVRFIVTAEIRPRLDDGGLLNLELSTVKVGAIRATFAAKMAARKVFEKINAGKEIEDATVDIAKSLLEDIAMDPRFKVNKKNARITDIQIQEGKLIVEISPFEQPLLPE